MYLTCLLLISLGVLSGRVFFDFSELRLLIRAVAALYQDPYATSHARPSNAVFAPRPCFSPNFHLLDLSEKSLFV